VFDVCSFIFLITLTRRQPKWPFTDVTCYLSRHSKITTSCYVPCSKTQEELVGLKRGL